jgi:asparagine synthase (glutamine-hydrolysing)
VFASSLRAMLASGLVPRKLDSKAIDGYVRWNHFAPNATPIDEVKRVEPATHAVYWRFAETPMLPVPKDKNPGYWTLRYTMEKARPFEEAVSSVRALMDDAVRLRLTESDVPVGVFLSGGVDSAAIAASAVAQGLTPRTFTIGFDDGGFDESADAEQLAKHLGTQHTTLRVGLDAAALNEAVAGVVGALDEPLSDASAIPTWLLARATREHVTVALSGDGGDEMFLGYDAYRGARLARKLKKVPGVARTVAMRLLELMAVTEKHRGLVGRARRFVDGLGMEALVRHLHWKGAVEGHRRWAVLRADPARTRASDYYPTMYEERVLAGIGKRDPLRRLQAVDFEAYLAQDVLIKVDRMSMDHGLEVRSPLLDHRLAELAWSLPVDHLLRGRVQKRVLREATASRLPVGWGDRPKRGFGVPLRAWLAGPLNDWVRAMCSPAALERLPMLHARVVGEWVDSLQSPKSSAAADVWCVAVLSAWAQSMGF